ncbi:MAG: ATP-binding protein [Candidatus Eiseniibacteriota bacterium]|nr:MAG: ATP-binding protein [Candidatus Eisenbacteria bacterium]
MEREFNRNLAALNEVFLFVDEFIAAAGLKEDAAFSVRLAVEELFTNLVRHNCGGRDHITIELERDAGQLVIRLKDFDVEPFDITKASPVDVRQSLEERRIGGLGIHLVRSIVDKLTYEYENRTLCVTAKKKLEGKDV